MILLKPIRPVILAFARKNRIALGPATALHTIFPQAAAKAARLTIPNAIDRETPLPEPDTAQSPFGSNPILPSACRRTSRPRRAVRLWPITLAQSLCRESARARTGLPEIIPGLPRWKKIERRKRSRRARRPIRQ